MSRMIDLHMHIIPDVDDGAESLEVAEQMLRMAIEQGVEVIFATSHGFAHEKYTEHARVQYRKLQKLVKEKELPLWEEVKRFENPHTYYVDLSEKLWNIKQGLLERRGSQK